MKKEDFLFGENADAKEHAVSLQPKIEGEIEDDDIEAVSGGVIFHQQDEKRPIQELL